MGRLQPAFEKYNLRLSNFRTFPKRNENRIVEARHDVELVGSRSAVIESRGMASRRGKELWTGK